MVNVNKDFMDGFVTAFALIDIVSNPHTDRPSPRTARIFKTALKAFEASDKNCIDPNELKQSLEDLYNIKFEEVESNERMN